MTDIPRKHVMITYPLLFSLCALTPLSLESISLQELIKQTDASSSDLIPDLSLHGLLNAQTEHCSDPHPSISLSFPILTDNFPSLQKQLLLSNVPIYFSYLDYALAREKISCYDSSFFSLPSFFSLIQAFPHYSSETPLPTPHFIPAKESVSLDCLLEPSPSHLDNLSAIDSLPNRFTTTLSSAPTTSHAPALALDKASLQRSNPSSFRVERMVRGNIKLEKDLSFAEKARTPSAESVSEDSSCFERSSSKSLPLVEIPITYKKFTSKTLPPTIGELLPSAPPVICDLIPLSFFYSHSLPLNIIATTSLQLEKKPNITAPAPQQEKRDLLLEIKTPSLAPGETTQPQDPLFQTHEELFFPQNTASSPVFIEILLPKIFSLTPLIYDVGHTSCLTELQPGHHLSPSFEPSVRFVSRKYPFSPDNEFFVSTAPAFTAFSHTNVSTRYLYSDVIMADRFHTYSDPYASDALITHLASYGVLSTHFLGINQIPQIGSFSPSPDTVHIPYSASLPMLQDVIENPSHPSLVFKVSEPLTNYAFKDPHGPFTKEIPQHLAQGRMVKVDIMDDLEILSLKTTSLTMCDEELTLFGLIAPEKELSLFAKKADYPFLQEFYSQVPNDLSPFLFTHDLSSAVLSSAPFLPYEKKSSFLSLEGAISLIEPLGNAQVLHHTELNNEKPSLEFIARVTPHHEISSQIGSQPSHIPNPYHFGVTYHGAQHAGEFALPLMIMHDDYIASTSCDLVKKNLMPGQSTLSPSLESLPNQLNDQLAYRAEEDFLGTNTYLSPNAESPPLLAYHYLTPPTLKRYSIHVDHVADDLHSLPALMASKTLSPSLVTNNIDLCPSRKTSSMLNQSSRNTHENLAQLPSLQDLHTLSLSDEFNIDVQVMQNTKGSGYLFSITLEPAMEKMSSGAPQNFIFLVDRSSSIDKNRFQIFKQAVNKSLPYLKETDTFNVLSFDTEISKMSHDSVPATSSAKHAARRFLETQKRGYKYIVPNLYKVLLSVHQMIKDSPIPTTVVLLTNGKSLENFNTQDEQLSRLISANQGGFTLFTACASHNNNTLMLEILSNLNRGEFMHSQTNAAFPRKLAAFVKHAGHLIAKDIHISAASTRTDLDIKFFPDASSSPNLYGDRSYTIIGKIDQLCDFDLVLQGRVCNNWLNVTKKVSFTTARHGNHSIYKDYTMHMAYNKYREFLKDGNTACLDEAKKVLQPLTTKCL